MIGEVNASHKSSPLVHMRDITKVFPENGVIANHSVHLEVLPGEVHAIVGENGSGKSTLMHLLSGSILPDSGSIEIDGNPRIFRSPHEALRHGIGMVHQHLQLVRQFTVLENVILGREPRTRWGRVDWVQAKRDVEKLLNTYGLHMSLDQPAYSLSIDGMQKTVLLSLLFAGVSLIILDEPMSLFERSDEDQLYNLIQNLRGRGHTLVLITHKLREALSFSDRISVMRSGRCLGTFESSALDRETLSRLMVSGSTRENGGSHGSAHEQMDEKLQADAYTGPSAAETLLELDKISFRGYGLPQLKDVSFSLHRGESVAVTGIRENGLETLEQILAGFTVPGSGSIIYKGIPVTGASIRDLRKMRIAYIPTERLVRGASLDSSVADNMIVLNYKDFHSWGALKKEEIEHFSGALKRQYNIKASPGDKLSRLSGGNIQRVIISRELNTLPELLIFSEPSWGLDLSGRRFVLQKIEEMKNRGAAVLIITSDIEEALECADRIVVMFRGAVNGIVRSSAVSRIDIGRLMLGVQTHG